MPLEKSKTNAEYLQHQQKTIECMASSMEVDAKQLLILMQTHMQINFSKSKKVLKG
jgi:hypothetical protein